MSQLFLFDIDEYDITKRNGKLANLRNSIRSGWNPFSVDKLEKASKMYAVSCEVVLKTYERVINELKFSDDSNGD